MFVVPIAPATNSVPRRRVDDARALDADRVNAAAARAAVLRRAADVVHPDHRARVLVQRVDVVAGRRRDQQAGVIGTVLPVERRRGHRAGEGAREPGRRDHGRRRGLGQARLDEVPVAGRVLVPLGDRLVRAAGRRPGRAAASARGPARPPVVPPRPPRRRPCRSYRRVRRRPPCRRAAGARPSRRSVRSRRCRSSPRCRSFRPCRSSPRCRWSRRCRSSPRSRCRSSPRSRCRSSPQSRCRSSPRCPCRRYWSAAAADRNSHQTNEKATSHGASVLLTEVTRSRGDRYRRPRYAL